MDNTDWHDLVTSLEARDVSTCVEAAAKLHREASSEDVPRLLSLLESGDFFIREAAAWPLAELAGPTVLPQLFAAYQRGFEDGHDNDGFTAALLEIPALYPVEAPRALANFIDASQEPLRGHAMWLLEFCASEAPGIEHGA